MNWSIATFQGKNFHKWSRALYDLMFLVNILMVKFSEMTTDLWNTWKFYPSKVTRYTVINYGSTYVTMHVSMYTNYSNKLLSNMKHIYKLNI